LIIKIKNKKLFQDYCKTFDSCLVEFDDAAENNILKSFLKSKYQHHKTGVGHSIVQGNNADVKQPRAVTTIEADEAGGEEKKQRKRRERGGTESQLQLVLIIDLDTLAWLLVHYKSLLSVLETVQSKSKSQAAADDSSYILRCYSNSILSLLQLCYITH
jgi:hypothetical protein